ncbi:MAG: alpha-amylase family glycosyl hydrolase [Clostridia bacterium]|nr:alpha-amylase family glycosyl hydrolase [Clostridia bacterium]
MKKRVPLFIVSALVILVVAGIILQQLGVFSQKEVVDTAKSKQAVTTEKGKDTANTAEEKISEKVRIVKANEFIDIDDKTVKFLFKTEKDATVEFYVGDSQDNLQLVKTVDKYKFQSGLILDCFKPGQKYYYQIKSKINGEMNKTPVLSFEKLADTKTDKIAEWAKTAVFYELQVMNFYDGNGDGIGDFKGLKQKINYLKELNIDALWLMPCFDSPSYHGYDVSDYYKIKPDYGTMEDFEAFLKEAHDNNIKVILDLVANHSSSEINWFKESEGNINSEYRNYYTWSDPFDDTSEAGPLGTAWHTNNNSDYYYGVFWSGMPDLNYRNHVVRSKMKEIAKFWLDKGVDGFRLDAAMHIDNKDRDVTHNWWQEFNSYVKSVNPNAFVLGENWTDTSTIAQFADDLDSSFNFPLRDTLLRVANGEYYDILEDIHSMYESYAEYSTRSFDSTFISNHDVGRLPSVVGGDTKKIKLAASYLLTLPGTPFLYYGDEIGQQGTKPDENIREPMDWYASAKGTGMIDNNEWSKRIGNSASFAYTLPNDGVSVAEQRKKADSVLNHYKKLINIRKQNPIFFTGDYKKVDTVEETYGYEVSGSILVVHNMSAESKKSITLKKDSVDLFTGKKYKAGANISITPYDTVIFKYAG